MDHHRPTDQQLIDACRKYPPDFIQIQQLLAQGADVNGASPWDPDDCVLSEIIKGYPEVSELREAYCKSCLDEDCEGCGLAILEADGRYLPQIIQFFLEHGFDVTAEEGRRGAMCLQCLTWSSYDPYILDACRLLLNAGADPSLCPYSDPLNESSVLSWVGTKASAARCCDHDHVTANLFETMYQIMDARIKGKNDALIEHFSICIGRQIDRVLLCADDRPMGGVFTSLVPSSHPQNNFINTVVMDCGGKMLCVSRYVDLYVDPHIIENTSEILDLAPHFAQCMGHTISGIDFSHRELQEGATLYDQPSIFLRLDNGKTLCFSINFGEVSETHRAAWFEVI